MSDYEEVASDLPPRYLLRLERPQNTNNNNNNNNSDDDDND